MQRYIVNQKVSDLSEKVSDISEKVSDLEKNLKYEVHHKMTMCNKMLLMAHTKQLVQDNQPCMLAPSCLCAHSKQLDVAAGLAPSLAPSDLSQSSRAK